MVFWVALGSALGGTGRYLLSGWIPQHQSGFPWNTLLINVTGSLLLGIIMRYALAGSVRPELRAFLAIGVCGGYTTFSTFSFETMALLRDGHAGQAASYVLASIVLSIGAVFAGYAFARIAI
jgi:fluoride exporter